mgnify:CR=1 FL=1
MLDPRYIRENLEHIKQVCKDKNSKVDLDGFAALYDEVKSLEKEKAITMRKEGKTYSQILAVVPVAKSTLSLWLQDVGRIQRLRPQKI